MDWQSSGLTASDRGRITHHIKPLLGKKQLDRIGRGDIERLLVDVRDGRSVKQKPKDQVRNRGGRLAGGIGVAGQCIALMSTMFEFAVARGLRADNPARGVKKPPVRKMERFLIDAEILQLARALDAEAGRTGCPYPTAAIKLLLLTGCRRGEITGLKWQHVDFDRACLRLPDSKTGAKVVYLNGPALEILRRLPRMLGNEYVIAGTHLGKPYIGLDKVWYRIRAQAGLSDVRLHDLRHSFASVGATSGLSLPIIGGLLGHRHAATTARYAHLAADPLRIANDAIGLKIAAAMTSVPQTQLAVGRTRRSQT